MGNEIKHLCTIDDYDMQKESGVFAYSILSTLTEADIPWKDMTYVLLKLSGK